MLAEATDGRSEGSYFEPLGRELKQVHARVRAHHAADYLEASGSPAPVIPPELVEEWKRLRGEHTHLFGQLDGLIRHVDSMADRPVEDRDVFFLRVRELIAVLRRHEAEEDRILDIALYRDTGGES